jgi:(1->4)-alpha-D-glucan 1-alpha-D-glucosylmutase
VEKILAEDEMLPAWCVDGTTGYDFARVATAVLCNASSALDRVYRDFTGDTLSFAEHSVQCKRLILEHALASELQMLVLTLERMAEGDRVYRDVSVGALRQALVEVVAHFPVYRSYTTGSRELAVALRRARRANPALSARVFDFVGRALEDVEFLARFQQITSPTMAKAVEDTAHYRYGRFLAMNEVGANPSRLGLSLDEFHAANSVRSLTTMIATSTHDTKRGEDARARLAVLSEMPEEWAATCARWAALCPKTMLEEGPAPSRVDEYFFFQTLIAALPFDFDGDYAGITARVRAYMQKAIREAKVHTSWVNQSAPYEEAVDAYIVNALGTEAFREELLAFSTRIARAAASNALAQCLIKICSPGVPDFFQGSELWEQSLVDPDNRRPVDFERCARFISERPPFDNWCDARVKQYITRVALKARRDFADEPYEPVSISEHVIAFRRGAYLCLATRFPWRLESFADLALPYAGECLFTGRRAQLLSEIFADLPVALIRAN